MMIIIPKQWTDRATLPPFNWINEGKAMNTSSTKQYCTYTRYTVISS